MCTVGLPPTFIRLLQRLLPNYSDSCLIIATSLSKNIRPLLWPHFVQFTTIILPKFSTFLRLKRSAEFLTSLKLICSPIESSYGHNSQNWKFIGSYQIPITLEDFKWIEVRSKMIGQVWMDVQSEMINEVKHRVSKRFPIEEDDRWELHQFSSPDFMEIAVYLMHCSAVAKPKPLRKRKWPQKQSKIDASLSDISKKTTKKPDIKRKWPQKDKLDRFVRLHSKMGSFEVVALFWLARQNVEKRLKSGAKPTNSSEILACVSRKKKL